MSAPTTHDPRFVNTRDGVCWERRAVTDSGLGLYAVEGSCTCPEFKMATFVELAAHGIVEWADVLPMPVGPVPQRSELDRVYDDLAGANLARWEEEQDNRRLRLALESAKRGRARLRAQVAALLDERRTTNEALDDAVQELRADRPTEEPSSGGYPSALPWLALLDEDDRVEFLDELGDSATVNQNSDVRLAEIERTCATWRLIAEAQHGHNTAPGPDAEERVAESTDRLTQAFAPVAALREDVSPQVEKLRALLAGQRSAVEDPHDSPLYHDYKGPGRDFPELGGAS